MLILSRKTLEAITIGDGIQVTVLGIGRSRVKLGIVAPKDSSVRRSEIDARGAVSDQAKGGEAA